MPEAQITRSEIVVVADVQSNEYNDMIFLDEAGINRKISNKRRKYFEDVVKLGKAIQLNFASAYGKEYVYSATPVSEKLPPPVKPPTVESKATPPAKATPIETMSRDERIDKAVWFKEIGECLRSGEIDKNTPRGKALRTLYYAEMFRVLDIQFGEDK